MLVLEQLLPGLSDDEKEEALNLLQRLVGYIVLHRDPLPTPVLAMLLDIPEHTIYTRLPGAIFTPVISRPPY